MPPPVFNSVLAIERFNRFVRLPLYLNMDMCLWSVVRLWVGEYSFFRLNVRWMIQVTEPECSSANGAFYPLKHYAKKYVMDDYAPTTTIFCGNWRTLIKSFFRFPKKWLTGNESLFILILPHIAEHKSAIFVSNLTNCLSNCSSGFETRRHLLNYLLPRLRKLKEMININ